MESAHSLVISTDLPVQLFLQILLLTSEENSLWAYTIIQFFIFHHGHDGYDGGGGVVMMMIYFILLIEFDRLGIDLTLTLSQPQAKLWAYTASQTMGNFWTPKFLRGHTPFAIINRHVIIGNVLDCWFSLAPGWIIS